MLLCTLALVYYRSLKWLRPCRLLQCALRKEKFNQQTKLFAPPLQVYLFMVSICPFLYLLNIIPAAFTPSNICIYAAKSFTLKRYLFISRIDSTFFNSYHNDFSFQ